MILKTKLFGKVYEFKSLREVMAKANEEKSGDKLAGTAAESAEERVAAKVVLSHITLEDFEKQSGSTLRRRRSNQNHSGRRKRSDLQRT